MAARLNMDLEAVHEAYGASLTAAVVTGEQLTDMSADDLTEFLQ